MTARKELEQYMKVWTLTRMEEALKVKLTEEEKNAFFLCSGFESKMDMIQKAEPTIMHSTMMDANYSGNIRNDFKIQTFEVFFNAREPEFTDAEGLANALDRAQIMMEGFIKDMAEAQKEAKKNNTRGIERFVDCDNMRWDTAGPFGNGWESISLFIPVTQPFNYCK